MKCPEVSPLVPRFFDGELEGRQMRTVALHVTRCADCERELRQLEGLQVLVSAHVAESVEAIDMSQIWARVETRIGEGTLSWTQRLAGWWEELEVPSLSGAWPALAGAAAVAVLTFGIWSYQNSDPTLPSLAAAPAPVVAELELDNSALIDSLVGSVTELTVDPENGTAIVWVSDSGEIR